VCVCVSNCVYDLEASTMRQSRTNVGCCAKENSCFVECKVCRYELQMVFGNHFDASRLNRVKIDGGNIKFYKELDDQNVRNNIV
jgi:hypothetical protein